MKEAELKLLDTVALLKDQLENGVVAGQIGTIVEIWAPGVYEVEFADRDGCTIAMMALEAKDLLRLVHEPASPQVAES